MVKKIITLLSTFAAAGLSGVPLIQADTAPAPAGSGPIHLPPGIMDINDLVGTGSSSFVCILLQWAFTIAIVLSVVFVLVAAFEYLRSGGNEEKTKLAKNYLVYAAIGVAVAILARGFPDIIDSLIPAGAGNGSFAVCGR